MDTATGIEELIAKHDVNGDCRLDSDELKALLEDASGLTNITFEDITRVEKLAVMYGQCDGNGINYAAIAKAISVWDQERHVSGKKCLRRSLGG